MKKQYKVFLGIGTLVAAVGLFVILSMEVYGEISFVKALRSNFMRTAIVPLFGTIITFGGIAFTAYYTSKNHKENKKHERDLLASKFIGQSRSEWLSEFRKIYAIFDDSFADLCHEASVHNPDLKNGTGISEEVFYELRLKVLTLNRNAKLVKSFLNPIETTKEVTIDGNEETLLSLDSKLIYDLQKVINRSSQEVNGMTKEPPIVFDISGMFDLESDCSQTFGAISKITWEDIKRDVNYNPKEDKVECYYSEKSNQFLIYPKN